MLDESELDHLFEEEINNMRREVISYIYMFWFILSNYCDYLDFRLSIPDVYVPHMDSENKFNQSKFDIQLPVGIEFWLPVHELGYNHGTMFF